MAVMMQAFEWYLDSDGNHFKRLRENLKDLKESGIDALWLPPFYKGTSENDVGYGVYDLYDLGEFDQKGTIRTKYGTKQELLDLIEEAHRLGINIYADVVVNHKAGADEKELFQAVEVDPNDRNIEISEPHDIEGWTKFTFPGRGDKYSNFKWNFNHFNGVDYDDRTGKSGIYRILGDYKDWAENVSSEKGNFDYLMFANIDHSHPDVKNEIFSWSNWLVKETNVDGFRFDAVKHIDATFMRDFIEHVRTNQKEGFYCFGEFWVADKSKTDSYLSVTDYDLDLFDVRLHFNMFNIANDPENSDIRKIFDDTLVKDHPLLAVTFVDNHDTQPGQSLTSYIDPWFKKIAYGIILLRKEGYPCIFYGDYYGNKSREMISFKPTIDLLLSARKRFFEASQEDDFVDEKLLVWKRLKEDDALIVLLNIDSDRDYQVNLGESFANLEFIDLTNSVDEVIKSDENGNICIKSKGRDLVAWAVKK